MDHLGDGRPTGAARVAGIYLVLGIVWIVLSDLGLLSVVIDPSALTGLQTAKGVFFVVMSAGVLYVLVAREQRRQVEINEDLELAVRHASVLHRLLRHNLRNSCDVILNNVALLRTGRAEEGESLDRIERQAETLVTIADKSRHLRDLVLDEETALEAFDIVDVVGNRVAAVREEFPGVSISVDAPDTARVEAHPRIGLAIEELVRNAIIHADVPDPSASVSVETDDGTVVVSVTDEGPGLPPTELTALDGTVEEPLDHSRGVGLWLVNFLAAKSGATLDADANDPSGTVVRLTFERAA